MTTPDEAKARELAEAVTDAVYAERETKDALSNPGQVRLEEALTPLFASALRAARAEERAARKTVTMFGVVSLDEPEAGPMALFDVRHLAETWMERHLPAESCIPTDDVELRVFTMTMRDATPEEAKALAALVPSYDEDEE